MKIRLRPENLNFAKANPAHRTCENSYYAARRCDQQRIQRVPRHITADKNGSKIP
jgi:hypothetical protein